MPGPSLDEKIASLKPAVDETIRTELQRLLRTLRDIGYPEGVLDVMMRLGLRLTTRLYESAGLTPPSDNLFDRIEKAVRQGLLPDEMASYLHLIRILSNKPHHDAESVRLQVADAENVLSGFLRVLEWFYCECPHGPRWPGIYAQEPQKPVTLAQMWETYQEAVRATADQLARLQAELERLRSRQAMEDRRRRLSRERIVGPVPGTVVEHFKDRVPELQSLRRLLMDADLRLVLVCGRGGIGKTSLITKLLYDMRQDEALRLDTATYGVDSIVYVALRQSEFRSPDRIVELICRTLEPELAQELREKWQERTSLSDKLEFLFRRILGRRRYLIVLDNFEDVLDEENRIRDEYADLREFVEKCLEFDHAARIVATSRRTLVLPPELEGRVGPRRAELSLDAGLPEADAVALLRDLDTDGRLGLREAPDETLRTVVRRCHGIPRTLETLVGTLRQRRTWTLTRLLEDEDALTRLTENPARELYESLSPEERLVVQALAVYDRPVPAAAVRYLWPALPVDEILDALVRNYVVHYDRGRFSIHPLDARYAYQQVPDGDGDYTKSALHARAAAFFRELRRPPSEWKTIDDLEPQLQEFHHLVRAGLYDEACRLLNAIDSDYLSLWGYSALIVELRTPLVDLLTDPKLQADNLNRLGSAFRYLGETRKAIECHARALEIARQIGDRRGEGIALSELGVNYQDLGEARKSIEYYEKALQIHRSMGDRREEAINLDRLGTAYHDLCEIQKAIEYYEMTLEIARQIGDRRWESLVLHHLGTVYTDLGEMQEAIEHYKNSLEIHNKIGDRLLKGATLALLGHVYYKCGELQKAVTYCEQALELHRQVGDKKRESLTLGLLGAIHVALGEFRKAIGYYNQALDICHQMGNRYDEIDKLSGMGYAYLILGEMERAVEYLRQALAIAQETGDRWTILDQLIRLGILCLEKGEASEAQEYLTQCVAYCQELLAQTPNLYEVLYVLALAQLGSGRPDEALATYRRALSVCSARGVVQSALMDLRLLERAKQPVPGLAEARQLLEAALTPGPEA